MNSIRYFGIYFSNNEHPNGAWLTKKGGELFYYPSEDIALAHIDNLKKSDVRSWERSIADTLTAREFCKADPQKPNIPQPQSAASH